jgi:hypothetical protein
MTWVAVLGIDLLCVEKDDAGGADAVTVTGRGDDTVISLNGPPSGPTYRIARTVFSYLLSVTGMQ